MTTMLKATTRGQVTLPKGWRDQYDTDYFVAEVQEGQLVIRPLQTKKTFADSVEDSWKEYKSGDFTDADELMEEYGL